MATYSVWVGGGEVADYLIQDKWRAIEVAQYYITQGYDDVVIEELED